MKKYGYNEITTKQFIFFIYKTQIGIGILTMPRTLGEAAGTDAWISILFGYVIALAASCLIIHIMSKHPEDTLYDLLPRYFGKWIGNGLSLIFIMYCAIAAGLAILSSAFIERMWIVPDTSGFLLIVLFMIPVYTVARNGVRVLGRYAEFVYLGTVWMYPLLLFSLKESHWLNLLPIAKDGWGPIVSAIKLTVLPFLGFELAFILYPFLLNKKAAYKGIIIANSISLAVYLLIEILASVFFSSAEVKEYFWPTMILLKRIELPFIERFEIVFLSFYFLVLSMTIIPYLFTAVFGTSQLMGKQDHRVHLRWYTVIFLLIAFFYNPSYTTLDRLLTAWGQYGIFFAYAFPVCLWAYIAVFQRFKRRRFP